LSQTVRVHLESSFV